MVETSRGHRCQVMNSFVPMDVAMNVRLAFTGLMLTPVVADFCILACVALGQMTRLYY